MSEQSKNEILTAIHEKVQALPDEFLTEKRVEELVTDYLSSLLDDDEFKRKMRFGQDNAESKLIGSKFYRWGLSLGDIEFLHDTQVALREANPQKYKGPSEELSNAFADISQAYYMSEDDLKRMDEKQLDDEFPRIPLNALPVADQRLYAEGSRVADDGPWRQTQAYQRAVNAIHWQSRAMDTAETGYGLELVGAQYVGELWQAARAQSRVFSLMQPFEMTAPTSYIPVEADIPEMLFVPESTAFNSANYATSKTGTNRVEVSAKKFLIHQMWSMEMEEDSIIPFVPELRRQAINSVAHYSDSVVLNGDTTNTATGNINLDDADPADTKHYLALDGIRHIALVDATGQGTDHAAGAISLTALTKLKDDMVDQVTYIHNWGHPTLNTDVVYVGDPITSNRVSDLDELVNWKIQRGGTLMTLPGQIGEIVGHPFISSMAMSRTEADGKVSTTAGNNLLGQVTCFNRRGFRVGWRRRVKIMMEPLPATDQMRMVHSLRMGFGRYSATGAAAGIKAATVLYNIAVA